MSIVIFLLFEVLSDYNILENYCSQNVFSMLLRAAFTEDS